MFCLIDAILSYNIPARKTTCIVKPIPSREQTFGHIVASVACGSLPTSEAARRGHHSAVFAKHYRPIAADYPTVAMVCLQPRFAVIRCKRRISIVANWWYVGRRSRSFQSSLTAAFSCGRGASVIATQRMSSMRSSRALLCPEPRPRFHRIRLTDKMRDKM